MILYIPEDGGVEGKTSLLSSRCLMLLEVCCRDTFQLKDLHSVLIRTSPAMYVCISEYLEDLIAQYVTVFAKMWIVCI